MLAFIFLWSSFLANVNSLNLALGRPCGFEESDTEIPYLQCYDLHFLEIYANVGRTCLDKCFEKTRYSAVRNFDQFSTTSSL